MHPGAEGLQGFGLRAQDFFKGVPKGWSFRASGLGLKGSFKGVPKRWPLRA